MNKKIISLALISIMILISLSTVLAAPYDLIHKTDISKIIVLQSLLTHLPFSTK